MISEGPQERIFVAFGWGSGSDFPDPQDDRPASNRKLKTWGELTEQPQRSLVCSGHKDLIICANQSKRPMETSTP